MGFFRTRQQELDYVQLKRQKSEELENQSQATIGFISSAIDELEETNRQIKAEISDVMDAISGLLLIQKDLENGRDENTIIMDNLRSLIGVDTVIESE
mgnify:CR=1 FL=1